MKFNINELDQEKLMESVDREVDGIIKNGNNFTRTPDMIRRDTIKGHSVERFLIENFNYIENTKLYHDVISPSGEEVECKVINHKWCTDYRIIDDPKKFNLRKWRENYENYNNARYVCVFSVDDKEENFEYYNTFDLLTGEKVEIPK